MGGNLFGCGINVIFFSAPPSWFISMDPPFDTISFMQQAQRDNSEFFAAAERLLKGSCYAVSDTFIGKGRFGRVFLGHDTTTQDLVAIKVVLNQIQGSTDPLTEIEEQRNLRKHRNVTTLLYHAADLRAACQRPNVVRDQQKNDKFLVMVLEYCEGGDLDKVLQRRGPLPENICRHLFRQLVEGLKHLQANGMMHRDLKPANLLLTSTDLEHAVLKLSDLGLAKTKRPASSTVEEPLYESNVGTTDVSRS